MHVKVRIEGSIKRFVGGRRFLSLPSPPSPLGEEILGIVLAVPLATSAYSGNQ